MCQVAAVRVRIRQGKLVNVFFTVEGKCEAEDVMILVLCRFVVKHLPEESLYTFVKYSSVLVNLIDHQLTCSLGILCHFDLLLLFTNGVSPFRNRFALLDILTMLNTTR